MGFTLTNGNAACEICWQVISYVFNISISVANIRSLLTPYGYMQYICWIFTQCSYLDHANASISQYLILFYVTCISTFYSPALVFKAAENKY